MKKLMIKVPVGENWIIHIYDDAEINSLQKVFAKRKAQGATHVDFAEYPDMKVVRFFVIQEESEEDYMNRMGFHLQQMEREEAEEKALYLKLKEKYESQ